MSNTVWTPDKKTIEASNMYRFMLYINEKYDLNIEAYYELYNWSISRPELFWSSVLTFLDIKYSGQVVEVLNKKSGMFKSRWFSGVNLNYAKNLLQCRDDRVAIEFYNENQDKKSLTYKALYLQVAKLASALKSSGLKKGDRVIAVLPNIPMAIIGMLATTSVGAIWSSCSPEFGLPAMLDRFKQINPKVIIYSDGYFYNGKKHNKLSVIDDLIIELTTLKLSVLVSYLEPNNNYRNRLKINDFMSNDAEDIKFEEVAFSDPLYILYSSGTTGPPKCIVHGVGGTLIQHMKELCLHTDMKINDKLFYYTSTGWMMWNWMVSSLSIGSTLVLYDGSPFYPVKESLLNLLNRVNVSVFGCSAKYISALRKNKIKLTDNSLPKLRLILSTGSPLVEDSFDYIYDSIKIDVQLSSISGGTDLISCFALGNPLSVVNRGELQGPGLGMNIKVFDVHGKPVINKKGELVCINSFPSMPLCFWNDNDDIKYHQAYFEKYSGVWSHGDYAKIADDLGIIIYGRSDATLNPSGVRIGTAEIYRQLESETYIIDSIVIAQKIKEDDRIILFLQVFPNTKIDVNKLKNKIKNNTSIYHVPDIIIIVNDIPKTYSGKSSEIAITNIFNYKEVSNVSALINPECLAQYYELRDKL